MSAYPKTKRREVNLFRGDIVAYNCLVGDSLEVGYSLGESFGSCPENMYTCAYSTSANKFVAYADGFMYFSIDGSSFVKFFELTADTPFIVEEYSGDIPQAVLVCNIVGGIATSTYLSSKAFDASLKCGTMHYGRLFGLDRADDTIVRWSGEGGVFDWTSSGFLRLKRGIGRGLSTFCLEDMLVVLREFGITEISAFGNYENYKQGVPIATDKVFPSSGAVVSGKLYFLSESGLKAYSDGSVERVETEYVERLTAVRSAICWGQCYILSGSHADFGDILFVYDTLRKSSYLIETSIDSMCTGDGVFIFKGGRGYKLERGSFTLKSTADFDTERGKALKSVTIVGDGKYDLEISNGRVSRQFLGVSGKIDLLFSGREFEFTLKGERAVKSFRAQAEVIDGV